MYTIAHTYEEIIIFIIVANADYLHSLGDDYVSGRYAVTFPAGATTMQFNVSISDDDILEHNETFQLTIDSSLVPPGSSIADPEQTTVVIINDDCK